MPHRDDERTLPRDPAPIPPAPTPPPPLPEEYLSSIHAGSSSGSTVDSEVTQGTEPPQFQFAETLAPSAQPADFKFPEKSELPPRQFGAYDLFEEIGRGGMGVIYRARQRSLDRFVALKMILSHSFATAETLERFQREARAAARLRHANIVRIYEIGEHEGQQYFSMALIEGGSLRDLLNDGPLPPAIGAQIVQQLAEAVQHAHEHGIVHRDIKPQNVLMAFDEGTASSSRGSGSTTGPKSGVKNVKGSLAAVPKLTDFGLARLSDSAGLSVTGEALGTPSYMPPEQARGDHGAIGATADTYSLGAVLYCVLTGRPPFQASTPLETMKQLQDQEPVPPRLLNPVVPKDLETICLKCLQKEPNKRYGTAEELAEELQRFRNGEPVQARPVSRLERGWRWCKRRPHVAGLAATLALVILGSLFGLTVLYLSAVKSAEAASEAERIAKQHADIAREKENIAKASRKEAIAEKKRAEEERKRAQIEAQTARRVKDLIVGMFEASDPLGLTDGLALQISRASGEKLTARDLLDRGEKKARQVLATEPQTLAAMLSTLGSAHRSLGDYKRAEALLNDALAMRQKHLAKDHVGLAETRYHLARLKMELGRYSEAEKLYEQAQTVMKKELGEDHARVLDLQLHYGHLFAETGELDKARALFKSAIAVYRNRPEHKRQLALALLGVAATHIEGNTPLKAVPYATEAKNLLVSLQQDNSMDVAINHLMSGLMNSYLPLGSYEKAAQEYLKAIEMGRKSLGDRHIYLAFALHELAIARLKQKKYELAEKRFEECVQMARETVGFSHPRTGNLVTNYGRFLRTRGKSKEALALYDEFLRAQEERFGKDHFYVADALVIYGEGLESSKKVTEAVELFQRAQSIYEKENATWRIRYLACLFGLSRCYELMPDRTADRLKVMERAAPLLPKHLTEKKANAEFTTLLRIQLQYARELRQKEDFTKAEGVVHSLQQRAREKGAEFKSWQMTASREMFAIYLDSKRFVEAEGIITEILRTPKQTVQIADMARLFRGTNRDFEAAVCDLMLSPKPPVTPEETFARANDLATCHWFMMLTSPPTTTLTRIVYHESRARAISTLERALKSGFRDADQLREARELLALAKMNPKLKAQIDKIMSQSPSAAGR